MTDEAKPERPPARRVQRPFPRAARLAGIALAAAFFGHASRARAQADINPQMPNVLLLVDTSGSMEYKTSSNTFPQCRYDSSGLIASPPAQSEKSRWTDMVEVLTGSIVNYDCQTIDRGSSAFQNEYRVSTSKSSPYDFLYSNPYHRAMSGTCVVGPGSINALNPADFPANSFNYHSYNNPSSSCSFLQQPDGILDSFQSLVRFGLMTFDTDPSPDQGEAGTYSYVVGNSHTGLPAGCSTPSAMEVGARNGSAPPWEGRLIPFGDPSPGSLDYQTKNQQIQQVLRASRPYGATPIAGMMSDARDFLRNDATMDPVDSSKPFGPKDDPYAACRSTVLLLLSDGQPNMDLRGHCNGSGCPFQLPEDIANDLLTNSAPRKAVRTFVIGFALNSLTVAGSPIDCSKITTADLDAASPTALCTAHPDDPSLQACCNLARIAVKGDDSAKAHAYFANDRSTLQSDIDLILKSNLPTATRTSPVFGTAAGPGVDKTFAASYRFFSNFTPGGAELWSGHVTRERWICDATSHQPVKVTSDENLGDLFATNLNTQSPARTFYTVQATNAGAGVFSDRTLRPNLTSDPDGVGSLTGTMSSGNSASNFVSSTSAASMGLTDTSCVNTVNGVTTTISASQCRDRYLKWLVGIDNGTAFTRCPLGQCDLMGDVFHSTPRVVPPPSELTRDESYQAFQTAYAARPLMLYTSSNDGFLHAFKVASNVKDDQLDVKTKKNNELWAFMPPEVLPRVASEYPFTHQLLLDGPPVVKDVVARKLGSGTYPYVFERTTADAQAGASASVTWRTILVQSFGGTYPGYFALDITNPEPTSNASLPAGEAGGPKFLWQLTSDASGNPLFGTGGATPIITTLLVDEDNSGVARETPVAILPGGPGGAGNAGLSSPAGCARATSTADLAKFGTYAPRPRVPCYTANLGARSLTIVRLDNGKIIRTFRRSKTELPAAIQARVIEAPLDSPITGEPVAYPSDVGAVADRLFVGDQDGALWKADLSNASPDQWKMTLFWDAFPNLAIHGKPVPGWNDGQPIATPPIMSVDSVGNITLAFSTGDQTALGAASNMVNYLWSLRDLPDSNHVFAADLLWFEQFLSGERVTGPISLFNSYLYFTSVTPAPANDKCSSGTTNIWGMHYLIPRGGPGTTLNPPDRTVGGRPALFLSKAPFNLPVDQQFITSTQLLGPSSANQTVIFGAAVAQVPTCFDSQDVPTDSYIGGHNQISNVNPGKFQLVMQYGSVNQTASTGKEELPQTLAVDLPQLATPSRIDAWASIVE